MRNIIRSKIRYKTKFIQYFFIFFFIANFINDIAKQLQVTYSHALSLLRQFKWDTVRLLSQNLVVNNNNNNNDITTNDNIIDEDEVIKVVENINIVPISVGIPIITMTISSICLCNLLTIWFFLCFYFFFSFFRY